MKTLLISLRAFGRRLAHAAGHYLDRASAGAVQVVASRMGQPAPEGAQGNQKGFHGSSSKG